MESITSGQRKQYFRFIEDAGEKALREAGLDKDSIQRLIENGGEFQADILASIRRLSVTNQFANEECASSYGYLSGYKPKSIAQQVLTLKQLFPELDMSDMTDADLGALPEGAEGWFAIPRWQSVASTYGEAVEKVLNLIKRTRNGKFYNYREGQLGPNHLRESDKAVKTWKTIAEAQNNHGILFVPCQFGIRHRGRSVRRAREVMNSTEFGLGAYAVGVMLLTHPERLTQYNDLWIDCAGDEFSEGDGVFDWAPCFLFYDDGVEFGAGYVDDAYENYGAVSGFLPQ